MISQKNTEVKIIAYNKVVYRGIEIKVIPELLQEINSGIITEEEAINYFEKIWKRELSKIRTEKLIKIGI